MFGEQWEIYEWIGHFRAAFFFYSGSTFWAFKKSQQDTWKTLRQKSIDKSMKDTSLSFLFETTLSKKQNKCLLWILHCNKECPIHSKTAILIDRFRGALLTKSVKLQFSQVPRPICFLKGNWYFDLLFLRKKYVSISSKVGEYQMNSPYANT